MVILRDGSIRFSHGPANKVVFRCNNPRCTATRNIYLKGTVRKYGKIHFPKKEVVKQ